MEAPILLVVEDAQWLDRSSAKVLALVLVARRLGTEPVALLLAVHDGAPNDIDDAGLTEFLVGRLDEDASRALLDVHGAELSDDLRARILSAAGGTPLALIELPVAAMDLELEPRSPASAPLPLMSTLERAFAARLRDLGADARALVLVAALDDGELDALTAAAENLRGVAIRPDSWAPAVAAGLGTVARRGFRFRHPLVRSAVEQAATVEERWCAHAALAEALAEDPDRPIWLRGRGRCRC
jgi:hypothetical protein